VIRIIVGIGLTLFLMSASAAEPEQSDLQEKAYDDAQVLGKCAGYLSFVGQIYAAQNKPIQAQEAAQKSNGWRIATMGALLAAGWKAENISRTADSIYEVTVTKWMARVEARDTELSSLLDDEGEFCLSHNQSQEIYREFLKKIANQSPD